MLDAFANQLKSSLGIESLTDYFLIDERKVKWLNYRLEILFEQHEGQAFVRFRVTNFTGSGNNGRRRKAYPWPVADPANPVEIVQITRAILAANAPEAEVIDPRSRFGRFFDRLCGVTRINTMPEIARCVAFGREEFFTARIDEDSRGRIVTIMIERGKGRAPFWFRLPIETVQVLHDRFAPHVQE